MDADIRRKILAIERAAAEGASRGIDGLLPETAGNLEKLVSSLVHTANPVVAIVTGFVIPSATPPTAENDGPIGAALLARVFKLLGWRCLILTDDRCKSVVVPVVSCAGLLEHEIFVAPTGSNTGANCNFGSASDFLDAQQTTHLLSIERPGLGYDGRYHNMKGLDISGLVYEFDDLFLSGRWATAAFGDGGNEIGMGSIPRDRIADNISLGHSVASSTPADFNVLCGVSNWGAYALGAAIAARMPERAAAIRNSENDLFESQLMEVAFSAGAVDGTTSMPALTVDGLPPTAHSQKKRQLFELAE